MAAAYPMGLGLQRTVQRLTIISVSVGNVHKYSGHSLYWVWAPCTKHFLKRGGSARVTAAEIVSTPVQFVLATPRRRRRRARLALLNDTAVVRGGSSASAAIRSGGHCQTRAAKRPGAIQAARCGQPGAPHRGGSKGCVAHERMVLAAGEWHRVHAAWTDGGPYAQGRKAL